jgi:broad specificity phosphatase PhoE
MSKIFLIRHGKSKGNEDFQEYANNLDCDIELSPEGERQADIRGSDLSQRIGISEYTVHYSPYTRAVQTADRIIKGIGKPPILHLEDCRIREREWEFSSRQMIKKNHEPHFWNYFHKPSIATESFAQVFDRVANFGGEFLKKSQEPGFHLVVAHGESLRCLMKYLLGWTVKEFGLYRNPRNCQLIQLTFDRNVVRLDSELELES